MKRIILAAIGVLLATVPATATDWQRIGPGMELVQAKAYCDLASMSVGQGYYAQGSWQFVLGASIGNIIGNAILQDRVYTNCMTLQGWQRVQPAYQAPKYKGNWTGGSNIGNAKKN